MPLTANQNGTVSAASDGGAQKIAHAGQVMIEGDRIFKYAVMTNTTTTPESWFLMPGRHGFSVNQVRLTVPEGGSFWCKMQPQGELFVLAENPVI